jgi:PAS domain S-box-containing protein
LASVSTRGFDVAFLTGGGEMGALMREYDWASTPLGPPESWPLPLKTAVRLILNTGHPMYIWWGPDLRCFYNDAYRRTLGPERHPGSLGRPGLDVWAEIWHLIGPQVDFVVAGRGSIWDENRPLPITRYGRLDEIYWTYSYSPIDDETAPNGVGGVLVVCTETTAHVLAERQRAADAERQRRLFEQAPGFIAVLSGPDHVFEFVNESFDRLFDRRGFVGKTVRQAFPELEGQGLYELLDSVYATSESFVANAMRIRLQATPEAEPTDRFLDFIYEPVRDKGGAVTGIFIEGDDVTEAHVARETLREGEERRAFLLELSDALRPVATPAEIAWVTAERLGERFGLSRVFYAELDGSLMRVERDYTRGVDSIAGEHVLEGFGPDLLRRYHECPIVKVNDVSADPRFSEAARAGLRARQVGAYLDVVLFEEERCVSILALQSATPRDWMAAEESLFKEVGERVRSAIERATAERAMAARGRRMATLARIAGGLVRNEADDERLQNAFSVIADEVGAKFFFNFLIDDANDNELRLAASGGLSDAQRRAFARIGFGEYLCGQVAAERRELVLSGIEGCLDPATEGVRALEVRAYAGFPLIADGQLIGTIAFASIDAPSFDDDEVTFMRTAADQLAAAIARDVADAALRASEARLAFLDRLGAETASLADADTVLSTTTRLLGEHLNLSVCAYADMDEDEDGFTIRGDWAAPGSTSIVGHFSLADFGKLAVKNLGAGLPLVVNDNLRELAPEEAATFQHIGIAATICMPLVKEGRLIALMAIHDRVPRVWTNEDLSLLREVTARSWAHVERVAAAAELRASEGRFRAAVDAVQGVLWTNNAAGEMGGEQPAWSLLTGQSINEYQGYGWSQAVHPDDVPSSVHAWNAAVAEKRTFVFEHRVCRHDGEWRRFSVRAIPILDVDGEIREWVGVHTDVTEQRATLTALRASEAQFRLMADAVPSIVWVTDGDGDVEFFNKQWFDYTGAELEPTSAAKVNDQYVHPEDMAATMAAFNEARVTGTTYLIEHRIRSRSGDYRWFLVRGEPYRDTGTGEIVRWFGASVDIHDRKVAEAQLRDLNETLEHRVAEALAERRVLADVIDGTDIFVQVADLGFNWLAINESAATEFARIFGVRRPRAGDNMLEMLNHRPADRAAVEAVWSRALGGAEFVAVDEFGDPSLDRRYYEMRYRTLRDADGAAIGAYQFVSDVTERLREQNRLREAEEALRQSQKMEAMGQLTGGVAHDFNNLLTPIIGSLDMLVRRGVGSERERRLIDGALQSADRAKTLVQRLLAFARRQPLQPVSVEIPKLVEGMVGLIGSTLGPMIDVRVDVAPDLPPARADPNQLEMALLNLAVNARDAMSDGGELTIKAKRESLQGGHASGLRPGDYVLLCVVDTGTGMDEATRQRAIEPFFSTKGVGKGTGLGLSMVHGLAAQLGGGLTIESTLGKGTAIELWLPVSAAPIGGEEAVTAAPVARVGRGVALLVDDEELVRMSTADMLMDLGFEVVEARSAEEALQLLKTGTIPNLLVTDHLMPGMNGADLAREARAMTPTLPVLIVSGYAEVDGLAPDLPRLTKPFRNAELAASVAALIHSAAG